MEIDDMVRNGAIRLGLAPKFGDREISVRRLRIWGPFGLTIFGETGKLKKLEQLDTKKYYDCYL